MEMIFPPHFNKFSELVYHSKQLFQIFSKINGLGYQRALTGDKSKSPKKIVLLDYKSTEELKNEIENSCCYACQFSSLAMQRCGQQQNAADLLHFDFARLLFIVLGF